MQSVRARLAKQLKLLLVRFIFYVGLQATRNPAQSCPKPASG